MDYDEKVLSQHLSQLLITNNEEHKNNTHQSLKRKHHLIENKDSQGSEKKQEEEKEEEEEEDPMPYYLLAKNKFFDQLIEHVIDSCCPYNMEDLRELAYFLHYYTYYNELAQLWSIFLKAGQGQLEDENVGTVTTEQVQLKPSEVNQPHRRCWSDLIRTAMTKENKTIPDDITEEHQHNLYEQFVHEYLQKYQKKTHSYEQKWNEKKESIQTSLTFSIEQQIQQFIEQFGITSVRMKCQHALIMLQYKYQQQINQYELTREKPTEYQKRIIKMLFQCKMKLENNKDIYAEHRQHLFYHQPMPAYVQLEIILPWNIYTTTFQSLYQSWINDYDRLIRQTKLDLFHVRYAAIEANISQYEQLFRQTWDDMQWNHNRHVQHKEMTKKLLELIEQGLKLIEQKFQSQREFYQKYYFRSAYGQLEKISQGNEQRSNSSISTIFTNLICHPSVNYQQYFNKRQLEFLNRGPTYIPPCQLQVQTSFQTIDSMVSKQYQTLQRQLTLLLKTYTNSFNIDEFHNELKDEFRHIFSTIIPTYVRQRALHEQTLIKSIQQTLKTHNLCLSRLNDQTNVFYLMDQQIFAEKIQKYFQQNKHHYELLYTLNVNNQLQIRQELNRKILEFNTKLGDILKGKKALQQISSKLSVKAPETRLGYLYFLPNLSTDVSYLI